MPVAGHSHTKTIAIAGSVGGVVGVAFGAFLLWLLLRWRRTTKEREEKGLQNDHDLKLQTQDADGVEKDIGKYHGKSSPQRDEDPIGFTMHVLLPSHSFLLSGCPCLIIQLIERALIM